MSLDIEMTYKRSSSTGFVSCVSAEARSTGHIKFSELCFLSIDKILADLLALKDASFTKNILSLTRSRTNKTLSSYIPYFFTHGLVRVMMQPPTQT